jgi:DNA-binding transcriptional LysR family regulator
MTLDQLQVLKTIIETGSFRAASEKLHRAQSAVSYAIRELEKELGTKVFTRSTYRPTLTDPGRAIHQKALAVLKEQAELEVMSQLLREGTELELNLSIAALAPFSPLTRVFCQFAEKFPYTRMTISSDVLGADRQLLAKRTDIAISETPVVHSELENHPFGHVEMWAVLSSSHAQAANIARVDSLGLREIPQILVMSTRGGEDRTAGVVRETQAWRVSDFNAKYELLMAGLGWGRMPVHWVENEVRDGRLKRLKESVVLKVPLFLIQRRESVHGPAAEFLWRTLVTLNDS